MRRPIGAIIALTVLGALATACSDDDEKKASDKDYLGMSWEEIEEEAKAEGELVFSAWWGEEFFKEAAAQFTEKYGIEARFLLGNNAIDKMLAEKDREVGSIDVQLVGGADVATSFEADLWYGPIVDVLPSGDSLDPDLAQVQEGLETNGYLAPIYRNQTGLLYNPDEVSDPPQTWEEFEQWIDDNPKGFAYPDPNKGGAGAAFVQAVIANETDGLDRYIGDTELDESKTEDWDAAWEWLADNNDDMHVTLSNTEDIDLLNQGAADLVIAWDDDTQLTKANGTLFKEAEFYVPEFGLAGGGDTAGVLKNAPNKAAGLLFLEFLASEEMQKLMNEILGSVPARTDVAGLETAASEEDKANATPWMPAPYKEQILLDYTENVLLR